MDYARAKKVLQLERTIDVLRGIIEAERAQFTRFDREFYYEAVRAQAETEAKAGPVK